MRGDALMPSYDTDETTIWRAVVVSEQTDGVGVLDYLRGRSRADPEGV